MSSEYLGGAHLDRAGHPIPTGDGTFLTSGSGEGSIQGPGATASGPGSIAFGSGTVASGAGAVAWGQRSQATGDSSVAMGYGSSAEGLAATAGGVGSDARADASAAWGYHSAAWAKGATTLGLNTVGYSAGQVVDAASRSSGLGPVNQGQHSRVVLYDRTTDATPTGLRDYQRGNFTFQDVLGAPDYTKTALLSGRVVARRTDTPGTASVWEFVGVVDGDGSSAYRWIGGSAPTPAAVAQDADASTWLVAVTISAAGIVVTVTGEAGKTIDWMCDLEVDEVI